MNQNPDHSAFLQNFEKDKNVLLKTAQDQKFEVLAKTLIDITIEKFGVYFNPLGLVDDTVGKILNYEYDNIHELEGIYENLCVAYRYKYGDNQLEIIWDGKSHEQKYEEEWSATFNQWVLDLTENPAFIKGILQITVFNEAKRNFTFVRNLIKGLINEYFEIKILKKNGRKRVFILEKGLKKVS